jgi:hypothetical protein
MGGVAKAQTIVNSSNNGSNLNVTFRIYRTPVLVTAEIIVSSSPDTAIN